MEAFFRSDDLTGEVKYSLYIAYCRSFPSHPVTIKSGDIRKIKAATRLERHKFRGIPEA